MQRVDPLPASIGRYHDMGGVLEFVTFDDADGSSDAIFAALCEVIPTCDAEALRAIGFRRLDDNAFYGAWYDPGTDSLLKIGDWSNSAGKLTNPKLRDLDDDRLAGGGPIPETDAGGEFAYAFSRPPYPLRARPKEIQETFDKIREFILPQRVAHDILDWSSADLPKVSPYFEQGVEWWGMFLFSIYIPDYRRLTLIMGSTTD